MALPARSRAMLTLAIVGALASCKDEKKVAAASGASSDAVRDATLQAIAAMPGMPKTVRFRGVQAYAQAAPDRTAVCGLVTAFADDATIFVPFVSVARQSAAGPPPRFEFDTHMGSSTAEASRVYLALVADCWDRGGPAPERPLALPPLPDALPDPHLPALPDPVAAAASPPRPASSPGITGIPATGNVTVRASANVHSVPGGPSVRTVSQGSSLHVFAQAPGGWYQVGDTAPYGWVHESMLNRP